jgi:hypothetical protein
MLLRQLCKLDLVSMLKKLINKFRKLGSSWEPQVKDALVFNSSSYEAGSWQWLMCTELKYGGYTTNVKRIKVSPLDPRSHGEISTGGMTGGDRMLVHGYAPHYANHLSRFNGINNLVVLEVGILKGTGLAIWCDLFPVARVIGLDIDLGHTKNNMSNLKRLGAFEKNQPELYEFDQLRPNNKSLSEILGKSKANIVIDDGLHARESILITLEALKPYLANDFVYFIEDNDKIASELIGSTDFKAYEYGELTVLEGLG